MKILFTILLCFITMTVFPMTVEEEIQKSVVKIPIVEIPIIRIDTLTIDMVTIDTIKTILVDADKQQIEELIIKVYDVSSQARSLRENIDSQIDSGKFKQHLKTKNWAMCSNLLLKSGVSQDVTDTLIASIGKVPASVEMPFFECKMNHSQTYTGEADENAFVVGTGQEKVQQGDVVIFDVSSRSNIIKGIKFIEKNKNKIGAVIIGWDSERMNNYDNLDISTYPDVMKLYADFYSICKGIKADLPIGVVVSMTITWREWLDACTFEYDALFVWNITKIGFNQQKVFNYFKPYSDNIIIAGMNATDKPLKQRYDSEEYRQMIMEMKEIGYKGLIWIK